MDELEVLRWAALQIHKLSGGKVANAFCDACDTAFTPTLDDWAKERTCCPKCGYEVWIKIVAEKTATFEMPQDDYVKQRVKKRLRRSED